ncbi:hypothetical protein CC86DRAFT_200327 [Ophiobolus disseminans]|uniref:Uncharacterized protein n=1 Tax=Ophiobolus disseminans TaxID=1469910 RepID=A0A6A7A4Y2_9PLEO|nr:hypothetical protein CC86DRAFT_200327 [Ophiobolus disseminans]
MRELRQVSGEDILCQDVAIHVGKSTLEDDTRGVRTCLIFQFCRHLGFSDTFHHATIWQTNREITDGHVGH